LTGEISLPSHCTGANPDKSQQSLMINGHLKATRAASCLLEPQSGDKVLYWLDEYKHAWIISVLTCQVNDKVRTLALPQNRSMTINTQTLTINAADSVRVNAIKEINLNVALGKLNECARSVCQLVQGTFTQFTKHFISRGEYLDFEAQKLIKSHGTQQLITAEKDLKVDAERINMG